MKESRPEGSSERSLRSDLTDPLQLVTEAALAYLDLDDLLAELLERISSIMGSDTAAILLVEDDRETALTPYHAIKLALHQLVPGTSAVVIGVGGLGHMAVQILRALSPTRVIATDIDPGKLELARAVGAEHTVASGEHAAEEIRELTHGRGATLVLDCVGTNATLALDAQVVAKGGDVMVIGVGGGMLEYRFNTLPSDASLTHPYWGSAIELAEVLELARSGHITAHAEHFPLERVADAYERMQNGTLSGRAVITPHG